MEQTRKRLAELEVDLSRLTEENRRLREALGQYGTHEYDCVLSRFEAGEPTENGYRMKFAGQWYDESPSCTCGFNAALASAEEKP